MKAYSMDLRERVLEAVDEGRRTKWEISLLFKVSPAWIRRLLQRRRETGSITPKQRDYTASGKVTEEIRQQLAGLVRQTPDATLAELQQRLGTPLSTATICRTLAKMGLPLKKSRYGLASRIGRTFSSGAPIFEKR
jgi:transposase